MSTLTVRARRLAAAGMTYAQVAAAIGSSRESVKKLIWRSRNPGTTHRRDVVLTHEQKKRANYVSKCRRCNVAPKPIDVWRASP